IVARSLFEVFVWVYQALKAQGYLRVFESLEHNLLVALDGVEYHSSYKINCPCCSTRTHKNGQLSYHHQALLPVIVAPEQESVISLPPEFITPQDGAQKQDCEQNAAKRWIQSNARLFKEQPVTLLGDDLYSRQPLCEDCLEHNFNFIFVCLPESHPTLYEWLAFLEANGELKTAQQRRWNGRYFELWHYRYVNQVPLRDQQPALEVNWCEVRVKRETNGDLLYHNSWITNHKLSPQRLFEVVAAGRSRWKTENENHNVLKTRGYHLEHNFGHGQRHLASFLLTLNLLAFLFHTVLQLVDERYQRVRCQRGTRKGFFQDILSLTKYLLFESWQHLLDFMLDDSVPVHAPRSVNTS
ncbi:MAG: ISNCY family transposase, partial [Cyanothece sp. SIO1E1]|nr:ISNCY family transposase [Cyanothece sp. SIO1E1]